MKMPNEYLEQSVSLMNRPLVIRSVPGKRPSPDKPSECGQPSAARPAAPLSLMPRPPSSRASKRQQSAVDFQQKTSKGEDRLLLQAQVQSAFPVQKSPPFSLHKQLECRVVVSQQQIDRGRGLKGQLLYDEVSQATQEKVKQEPNSWMAHTEEAHAVLEEAISIPPSRN
jgi:hypothetical protein